jgi:hypothetical protein
MNSATRLRNCRLQTGGMHQAKSATAMMAKITLEYIQNPERLITNIRSRYRDFLEYAGRSLEASLVRKAARRRAAPAFLLSFK